MKLLKSANFSGTNGDKFQLNLYYEVTSQSIENNTSKIKYSLYWKSLGYSGSGSTVTGYINNDSVGTATSIATNENKLMGTKTVTIKHNDDGKFPNTSYSAKIDTPWTLGDASVSGTLTSSHVDTIPRKSTITCADTYIEDKPTIKITRASSSFTHTLRYTFGSLTNKTIVSKTTSTSYNSWTIPTTFYEQIPNDTEGKVTLYCDTYSGSTLIGTSSTTFKAKTKKSRCLPVINKADQKITVIDNLTKTLTLDPYSNTLIKGVSDVLISIAISAKNSATITEKKVVCGSKSGTGTNITLNNITSGTFTISGTDSRKYTNSVDIIKDIIPYISLTLNYKLYRTAPTNNEIWMKLSGNYFNGNFSNTDVINNNELSIKYRYKPVGGEYSEYITIDSSNITITEDNTYSVDLSLGANFDYKSGYNFEIIATDKVGDVLKTTFVSAGIPIMGLFNDSIETFGTDLVTLDESNNPILNLDLIKGNITSSSYTGSCTIGKLGIEWGRISITSGDTATTVADTSFYSGSAEITFVNTYKSAPAVPTFVTGSYYNYLETASYSISTTGCTIIGRLLNANSTRNIGYLVIGELA